MNYYVIHWYSRFTGKGGEVEGEVFENKQLALKRCEAMEEAELGSIDYWPVPVRTNKQANKQASKQQPA